MNSHLRSSVRYGLGTGRIANHYNEHIFAAANCERFANVVILIDNGKQCTISGMGRVSRNS